jgi:hypothetical protein
VGVGADLIVQLAGAEQMPLKRRVAEGSFLRKLNGPFRFLER